MGFENTGYARKFFEYDIPRIAKALEKTGNQLERIADGLDDSLTYKKLEPHIGHKIVCVRYGEKNISIECEDCYEVLASVEL